MRNIFTSSRYKIVETFVLIGVKLLLLRYFFYGGFHPAGLPGELLSVLALLCLVELVTPAKGKWWTFFGFNFVLSFILFAATVYFAYFGTVPTYKVLSGLGQVPEVKASIGALIRPGSFCILPIWRCCSRSKSSGLSAAAVHSVQGGRREL
ncbi:hypothetical protein HMSSN036_12440 [Paenibacillus macerans]|nr:hypothetical protein HMSSN036_12440 [Paenibacillus macerans]